MSSFRGHAADGAAAPLGGLQMIESPLAGKIENAKEGESKTPHRQK
jgi:hypothetical protein